MMDYLHFCFTNYMDFWIMYFGMIALILLISLMSFLEDNGYLKPYYKHGQIETKTLANMTLVIPVAKTVYTVIGHFSKTSKCTAKDKLTRIIKREIQK